MSSYIEVLRVTLHLKEVAGVYCVNNATNAYTVIDNATACDSVPALDTLNATTVSEFLGAGSTDTAALVNFSAFFDDLTQVFTADQKPTDGISPHSACSGTGTYPCYQENKKDFPNIIQ